MGQISQTYIHPYRHRDFTVSLLEFKKASSLFFNRFQFLTPLSYTNWAKAVVSRVIGCVYTLRTRKSWNCKLSLRTTFSLRVRILKLFSQACFLYSFSMSREFHPGSYRVKISAYKLCLCSSSTGSQPEFQCIAVWQGGCLALEAWFLIINLVPKTDMIW